MSNKRIDLTQFTGITPGPWKWDDGILCNDEATHPDYDTKGVDVLDMFLNSEATNEDANAIAKVPELIAELKKCYERIDYLENIAEEYRQERPEEYCANCYAHLSEYDGDGVKECLCSDCEASE